MHLFNSTSILLTRKTELSMFCELLVELNVVFSFPRHCKNGLFSACTFQFSSFLRVASERSLPWLSHIHTLLLPEVTSFAAGVAEVSVKLVY